ncbi:MAG: hypothetical protein RSG96_10370, partial [Clostridia bacterium]
RIQLTVFRREERLTVEVVNNGKKLSEEDFVRIRRLMSGEGKSGEHMGIHNVARRLKLLYGTRASLVIHADERGQTVAAFTVVSDKRKRNRYNKGSSGEHYHSEDVRDEKNKLALHNSTAVFCMLLRAG